MQGGFKRAMNKMDDPLLPVSEKQKQEQKKKNNKWRYYSALACFGASIISGYYYLYVEDGVACYALSPSKVPVTEDTPGRVNSAGNMKWV